ncbi:MAG: MerR family transcriptional regulator [Oscillospiraceae bacterium]|nr:MerR family transcriptional regulator [Oscillospiraceae bacterium]
MEYTIQKLAQLAGVTTRTLRYYDEIGLLPPLRVASTGYRIYGPKQVDTLQQILLYRNLGMPLTDIAAIIKDPDFNRIQALQTHLQMLQAQQQHLAQLIQNVNNTILSQKGAYTMTDTEKFYGLKKQAIAENEAKFGAELQQKYGKETIETSNKKLLGLSAQQYEDMQRIGAEINTLLEKAVLSGESPSGTAGQKIALLHKQWLTYTWAKYTPQAHIRVAQLYVCDPRFTAYYDKNVEGCAAFLQEAILTMTSQK